MRFHSDHDMVKCRSGDLTELSSAAAPASSKPVTIKADQRRVLEEYLDLSDLNNFGYRQEDFQDDNALHPRGYYLSLIADILSHAANTFGSNNVRSWLRTEFHHLRNQTPLETMRTYEGALAVQEYLTQIDEGIFG